jgi:hypothetical protein
MCQPVERSWRVIEAMASGEARAIETGGLQAGDPSPTLSGGDMDAAGNRGHNRTHRRAR